MVDKIIGIRPDGTLNSETIAAIKEIAGTATGAGSVAVTDDGAGTYTVGGTTIKGLTTQGQLPAVAKKYVDDGLAGKASTTHTHAASAITTGTLDPARLPVATTSANGALSAADKTKLDGLTPGGSGLTGTQATTVDTLTDGITKTKAESTAYTIYQTLRDRQKNGGITLTSSDMEDPAKWLASYGGTIATDTGQADTGTRFLRLPAENNNPAADKAVHGYLLQPVSITSGKTYTIRARARTTGTVGADDFFRLMVSRYTAPSTTAYLTATNKTMLTTAGVGSTKYTDIAVTWTSTVTEPNAVFGFQGGLLDSDLLLDNVAILDTSTGNVPTDNEVSKALADYNVASSAARAAWTPVLPATVMNATGGGTPTQTITRTDYDARRAAGTLDPNILYMVSV